MKNRVGLSVLVAAVIIILGVSLNAIVANWPKAPTRTELLLAGSCELPFEDGVKANKGDRCAVALIAKRCGDLDQCFVNCFTSGKGVRIGGGCTHICNYELSKPWHAPEGSKACYSAGEDSELY
jgi:hypothetical protein